MLFYVTYATITDFNKDNTQHQPFSLFLLDNFKILFLWINSVQGRIQGANQVVLFKKIIYTDCPTAGSTAGRMPAGRAQCSFRRGGRRGGLRTKFFLKLEQKNCKFKVFFVLEINSLKQVKICLKIIFVTFKTMCDVTLVT